MYVLRSGPDFKCAKVPWINELVAHRATAPTGEDSVVLACGVIPAVAVVIAVVDVTLVVVVVVLFAVVIVAVRQDVYHKRKRRLQQ